MEPMFENQFEETEAFYREFYRYSFSRRPILLAASIVSFACLLMIMYGFFVAGMSNPSFFPVNYFIPVILLGFIWALVIIRPFRTTNIQYQRALELNNGKLPTVKMTVSKDGIDVFHPNTGANSHITYASIKKMIKTKNYFVLITTAKLGISFKKDSFTKGSAEEFLVFFRDMGYKC